MDVANDTERTHFSQQTLQFLDHTVCFFYLSVCFGEYSLIFLRILLALVIIIQFHLSEARLPLYNMCFRFLTVSLSINLSPPKIRFTCNCWSSGWQALRVKNLEFWVLIWNVILLETFPVLLNSSYPRYTQPK